jgi:glycosyltransferase involved in cell wall biosynthesis
MRAGMMLTALSRHADIFLLIVPIYGPRDISTMPLDLRAACRDVRVLADGPDAAQAESFDAILHAHRDVRINIVHVFRLSMLPYAHTYLARSPHLSVLRSLDLDDVESETHRRLAQLARQNGDEARALDYERLAERYFLLEQFALHSFDWVFVCSEDDRVLIRNRCRATIDVLPNVVGRSTAGALAADAPWRVVFVGTLGYYPNEDALLWFMRDVLPRMRRRSARPFQMEIVGTGESSPVRQAADTCGVTLTGEVPDVGPVYDRACAVIVPVRAGGGTRIKVLEAFAHQRPVVSTSVGCEGIDAQGGIHLLVADEPGAFAEQCLRLMTDSELCRRLTTNAYELVRRAYSAAVVDERLSQMFSAAGA